VQEIMSKFMNFLNEFKLGESKEMEGGKILSQNDPRNQKHQSVYIKH
jgi:hypothetical protein